MTSPTLRLSLLLILLTGCADLTLPPPEITARDPDQSPDGLAPPAIAPAPGASTVDAPAPPPELVAFVRDLGARANVRPMPPAPNAPAPLVELGRLLAFDKILSGNGDVSCMTCHHPALATADARSLSIGTGGEALGMARTHPENARIPRNAPPLFNLHAQPAMFWDGRVRVAEGRLLTPADGALTGAMRETLAGPAAAQAMFPVTSRAEMRGELGDNELAAIDDADPGAIWAGLMARLGAIGAYVSLFEAAYPGERFESMTFAHAANAIAAFEISAYEADETPWDHFLRGDDVALTEAQLRGAEIFLGRGRCVACHGGPALSDFRPHDTAVPQIGPGLGDGPGGDDDFGVERVSGAPATRYAFRTPPLRNIELTAPYGHDGAYVTLGAVLAHYRDPRRELRAYDSRVLEPALRNTLVPNTDAILANLDPRLGPVPLSPAELGDLRAFMGALTDPASRDLLATIPARVPSGLPVVD